METKAEFLLAVQTQLREWEVRLKAFQAGPNDAGAERRLERHEQELELRMRQGSARQFLSELRRRDEATWRPVHQEITDRWSALRAGVEAMWLKVA
jgi:hypothetical protein